MLRQVIGVVGIASVLLAAPMNAASAADMPYRAPPWTSVAPAYDWSGFYLGINGGYGVGADPFNQVLSGTPAGSSSINSRVTPLGGLFGGQVGYNYQMGHVVFGLEGDIQWADQNDTAGCGLECIVEPAIGATDTLGSVQQKITWFGTARGRLGWANDGWLFYVTGGGAWGGVSTTTTASVANVGGLSFFNTNTANHTQSGWVLGGGTEVRIAGPWTAKFEYLYMDLGSTTDTLALSTSPAASLTTKSWIHDNIVRVGLNYKFNLGGPEPR
jgi:outer membrane immunogenic protein